MLGIKIMFIWVGCDNVTVFLYARMGLVTKKCWKTVVYIIAVQFIEA
jgi:hypothetical protein